MQMLAVGPKIRAFRIERGWTQSDLSHYSRMSAGDISRIETGRLIPTRGQVKRLADALNIPRQEVLQDEHPELVSGAE